MKRAALSSPINTAPSAHPYAIAKSWGVRSVLAGVYRGSSVGSGRAIRTHMVGLDAQGSEVIVACGRVPVDHLADEYSLTEEEQLAPTCKACLKKWVKR